MHKLLEAIVAEDLPMVAKQKGRSLFMPGDNGRYQPDDLKPFLGYDMWASFLILVEWFWLMTLATMGIMPAKDAALLTSERLMRLLKRITTTMQDNREYGRDGKPGTNHDILALLELMRRYLPISLHKYLHLGATSYDIICTAYALILKLAFTRVFWPRLKEVDEIWRQKIKEHANVVQAGRTHLQTALPVTLGLWLAVLHHQYNESVKNCLKLCLKVPGKFTGAVGTSAALKALLAGREKQAESILMDYLGLKPAAYGTQITPPQPTARFYFEQVLLTGVLANLGEDVRILQSSQFGEIISASSSSSTMAHKKANPIAAENNCGMHVNVIAENMKVVLTLVSDLQRDLRWSSVMRSFSSVMVYSYQQLLTTKRLLSSLAIDRKRIKENFDKEAHLVVAELLHLELQRHGYPNTHELVNKIIVPAAAADGHKLTHQMDLCLENNPDEELRLAWKKIPASSANLMRNPEKYIGNAVELALRESKNTLKA